MTGPNLAGDGAKLLTPIAGHLLIEDGFLEEAFLDNDTARYDDAYWARVAGRFPAAPQTLINWWIARRWVRPRDITKE